MIHAYDKLYLEDSMEILAVAIDYAVNAYKIPADTFMDYFITSGVSTMYQHGNPHYVTGMSGIELVWDVLDKTGLKYEQKEYASLIERTPEYWAGWILAYYQWYTGRPFSYIQKFLPISEIIGMYHPYHEASEEKFVATAYETIKLRDNFSKVKELRLKCQMTQRQLSEKSGVNIRTLQQYENRSKDIRKASAETLYALARALNSTMEALLN